MTDTHRRVRRNLPLYAVHDLDRTAAAETERHLRECLACRRELSAQRALTAQLRGESVPATGRRGVAVARWLLPAAALLATFALGYGFAGWSAGGTHRSGGEGSSARAAERFYREYVRATSARSDLERALSALARSSRDR